MANPEEGIDPIQYGFAAARHCQDDVRNHAHA